MTLETKGQTMTQPQSVDAFKDKLDRYLNPVFESKAQLQEFDSQVEEATDAYDNVAHDLQRAISTVVKEKVFTKEFLASKGFKQATGRQAVKVDVEEKNVPFNEMGDYINTTFQNLQQLGAKVEEASTRVESMQDTRDALYQKYADVVHAALESKAVSRPQLTSFGISVPPKSATTKAKNQTEERQAEPEHSESEN